MRMIITPADVSTLTGKFIIQINVNTPDETLNENNWEFYKEKRISFVCGLKMVGFFYEHGSFDSAEEFATYFNDNNDRYHRLLTSKELDFVNMKMKQSLY